MENIVSKNYNVVLDNTYENFIKSIYMINSNKFKNNINNLTDIDNSEEFKKFNINDIYDQVLIITDENVYKYQMNDFIKSIRARFIYEYIIPAGEDSKSIETYEKIINYCIRINMSRKSLIVALGGGVVGDLAGFIASTYMRGIDVIQVPTSLLSQVDSSIGGKTGINLGHFKNIIGTFYQPKLTYININALRTLKENEFISNMAEVIKYCAICDFEFLSYLNKNSKNILNREEEYLYYIVKKCAKTKLHIVSQDEKESGIRKVLNFGHTFGHGVEKILKISHGEAVSIGMAMAFRLSLTENLISKDYYNMFIDTLNKYNLPLTYNIELDSFEDTEKKLNELKEKLPNNILDIMKNDKKNSFGKINLILPNDKGCVLQVNNIDEDKILKIIRENQNV